MYFGYFAITQFYIIKQLELQTKHFQLIIKTGSKNRKQVASEIFTEAGYYKSLNLN